MPLPAQRSYNVLMPTALKSLGSLGLVLALSAPVFAQDAPESLQNAASKEKERRKAAPRAKTYTEVDLAKASNPNENIAAPEAAASPTPGSTSGKREKTDDETRAEKKAQFEKRIAEQVATLGIVRKAMDDAQLELNDMTTMTQFGSRKEALQKLLDDGRAELKKGEEAIAAIEEEARRAGILVSRP